MLQKITAYILLLALVPSQFFAPLSLSAAEINSLDELPYGTLESESHEKSAPSEIVKLPDTLHERKNLLDAFDAPMQDEMNVSDEGKNIAFSMEDIPDIRTLLAERIIFDRGMTGLTPGTMNDTFLRSLTPTGTNPLDLFVQSGAISLDTLIASKKDEGKKMERKVSGVRGKISVSLPKDLTIRTESGETIDPSQLVIEPLGVTKKTKAKAKYEKGMKNRGNLKKGKMTASPEGFEFGIVGKHLIFSSPVALTIDTPFMTDGNMVDLLILHEGDADFNTRGLSVDPTATCDALGNTDKPGTSALVKNGKITFYTCGASSFTMNPSGGTTGSNDLRIIVGDCAQAQIYYNNLSQIYTGNPTATGCGLPAVWAALRIGATTYGNGVDGVTATAWTTQSTTGSTNGNNFTATSTMTRVVGGLTYTLIIDWNYTAPNKYLTWRYRVTIPTGNTANVRFYFGNDSFVAGADANDVGYISSTGGLTIGVYDNVANVLSAYRYLSGAAWTAHEVGPYATVASKISNGTDFANTVQTGAGDLGFGVNWNLGTTPSTYSGTVEWRLIPYSTGSVSDLVPGIGQPEGPLVTNLLSQLPITITNAGTATSSGLHTIVFTVPTNITGPASPFTDNGWSCGAQVGTGVTCTKTAAISGSLLGEEVVRIPVTPTLAASGTNVTFNVAISNPGDSNITNNTAFSTNAVVGGAPASDPGGITGENLWLQANSGTNCTTSGCTITSWTNLGALGTTASGTTGSGTVLYSPTQINGNPTLYFNNASLRTNNNLGITASAASIFAVTRVVTGGSFLIGSQTNVANALSWSTSPTADVWRRNAGTIYYSGANSRTTAVPAITSTTRQTTGTSSGFTNGRQLLTSATAGNFTAATLSIGRNGTVNSTLGHLAEVIVYPNGLTAAQKNQVESYLAIKYGITLDQTTATNYLGSNGTILWNASTAGAYNKNIAGIARDDTSTLNQARTQSVTNTGDIIVTKSAIATNRQALIWGNDAASIAAFTGTDAGFGFQRIPREWQFQEKNGDIGTVTIAYPTTSVPIGFTGTLMMLVDADGAFATGATSYTGTLSGSNWQFSANISDMQYVTFAKQVPTDFTPPFITSNSVASGTLAPAGTFPITISYADTGSTILPATLTGRIFAWNATGGTWDVTNIAASYLSITSATTSTGVFQLSNLPFGKYRFDFLISDSAGNTLTASYTYFVDGIEWTISAPVYSIGNAPLSATTFGTGELTITIRTVGAGFDLTMLRTTDLTYITDVIPVYSGSTGWGYDKDIGSGYSSILTPHGTSQNLVTVAKSINTNGQKNTFTYRVKYGVNPPANNPAGDYQGLVRFGINLTY